MKLSKADVSKILAVEFIFFPHMLINPELVKAWHLHFKNCEAQDFFAALHIAVTECKNTFPPVPADVWRVLRKLKATPESLETADQAWEAVLKNKNPSPRAIAATQLMQDWDKRGMWQTEFMHFKKKDFERIYTDLKEKDQIMETQNIARTELGYGRDPLSQIAGDLLKELGWQ